MTAAHPKLEDHAMASRKALTVEEQAAAHVVRQTMTRRKVSLDTLAEMTGIPRGTLQGIVEGTRRTTLPRYVSIARALDIPFEALMPAGRPSMRDEITRLLPVLDDHFVRSLYIMLSSYVDKQDQPPAVPC